MVSWRGNPVASAALFASPTHAQGDQLIRIDAREASAFILVATVRD
jgi:hypothetical protein